MASTLSFDRLADALKTHVTSVFRDHPAAVLSTLGAAVVLPFAVSDYRLFLSYVLARLERASKSL
jgi:hypothetical protein